MNILFVAAEVAPFIKTGGLADVAGALPPALRELGHDARIVMPLYRRLYDGPWTIEGPIAATFLAVGEHQEELRIFQTTLGQTPVYLLDIPAGFARQAIYGEGDDDRRFILFARGVLALIQHLREIEKWQPDIVHANDWHTGLIPNYLKTFYSYTFGHIASVYTIHNLAYQGRFGPSTLHAAGLSAGGLVEHGIGLGEQFNFMARGLMYADVISTVSPTYAQEILNPAFGEGLDHLLRQRQDQLVGILNGIDFTVFDPEHDPYIAANYSADDPSGKALCKAVLQQQCGFEVNANLPLIGMVTRLAEQKGLDLVYSALPELIQETNAQLVLLGSGQPDLEAAFSQAMQQYPSRVHVRLGFDAAFAQQIYAGSDAFLMPSRYEPGGLGQLIALRYGSVPIVRATGGLDDTVREGWEGNGFRFHPYDASIMLDAIRRCISSFNDHDGWAILRARGMREDHSWASSAREYVAMYEMALRTVGR
jgi:starch synthase